MSTNSIAGKQLLAFIERIKRLEEDEKSIKEDKKEVYAEAKGTGYDVKIIRKIVTLRKQDQDTRREEEELLDLYLEAISNFDNTPLGAVARRAVASFGEPQELTEEEKAEGYSAAFKGKDGNRVAMKFGASA